MGYIGGKTENPSYEEVCGGRSGHVEAVQMTYDPKEVYILVALAFHKLTDYYLDFYIIF